MFDERAKRIEEGQKAAAEAMEGQAQIAQLKKDTQKKLDKDAAKIMEAAVKEAEAEKARIIAAAQEEASLIMTSLQQKWQTEQASRVKTMHEDLVKAVVLATEEIVDLKLKQHDQQALVEGELDKALKYLRA
ncbi:hypothetical protein LDC_1467 [sediment metagenome]|uniref:Uncharacterized protein n=1 Tax=sediment metagenome TaxID=749907 RepID=D9PIV9_9ZZZZ